MKKNALTVTIVANMTSNYSEGLGNISSVQKIYRDRNVYAIRSRESLKNAIMVQSGMYKDLETEANGATQKKVDENLNATNCRALEGGYMNTKESTYVRNSSFYLTDAISTESFINETRFHNNLYLATNYANANNLNVQKDAGKVGLMPYQYEYEKSLKVYSLTIDLEKIGKDPNFPDKEADNKEIGVHEVLVSVKAEFEGMLNLVKEIKVAADEENDYGTSAMVDEYISNYEKNLWMLNAYLKEI